jgi:hypothetical protein
MPPGASGADLIRGVKEGEIVSSQNTIADYYISG